MPAPAWGDQVLRLHLGDLMPPRIAARMDYESFARVWVLSQRGAETEEGIEDSPGARVEKERTFGKLRVRLYQRPASVLRYDFIDSWRAARVSRVQAAGKVVPCEVGPEAHQCPDDAFNFVRPRVLEIGNTLRRALLAQPVAGATVAIDYADVPMGKELAVGAGLHNVWRRKGGDGTVVLRVLVDGQEIGRGESGNRTGWQVWRFPTPALSGRPATVRFEITSAKPFSRALRVRGGGARAMTAEATQTRKRRRTRRSVRPGAVGADHLLDAGRRGPAGHRARRGAVLPRGRALLGLVRGPGRQPEGGPAGSLLFARGH